MMSMDPNPLSAIHLIPPSLCLKELNPILSSSVIDGLEFNKIYCQADLFASSITPDCPLFSPGAGKPSELLLVAN